MNTALIKNNLVENVIVIEPSVSNSYKQYLTNLGYLCVDSNKAKIGDTWNGTDFITPASPEPVDPDENLPKRITRLAFRNRFTTAEKINIELAALDDPTASAQQRQNAALIRVYLKDIDTATYIDLDRQDTKDDVQNLETVGLLASGRATEILTAKIQPSERYRG